MQKNRPTPERLREAFDYNPHTGLFRWRIRPNTTIRVGDIAGNVTGAYRRLKLDGVHMMAHRAAYAYMTGRWPDDGLEVDHRDRVSDHNAWSNLRLATPSQQKINTRVYRNNQLGIKGVRCRDGRFQARINDIALGTFDTAEEASAVYIAAARAIYGEFSYA